MSCISVYDSLSSIYSDLRDEFGEISDYADVESEDTESEEDVNFKSIEINYTIKFDGLKDYGKRFIILNKTVTIPDRMKNNFYDNIFREDRVDANGNSMAIA